jgi:hypothetical protein
MIKEENTEPAFSKGGVKRIFPFKYDWSERQFFVYACFVPDLQQFYNDWIEQAKGRAQFFDVGSDGKLTHKYWQPSNICCESGEVLTNENIDVKIGYWVPYIWKPIRKDLKQKAMKFEAYECQKIDCSCNDCLHLERSKSWCNKFDKKTTINGNICHPQNQECFEHRRSYS